MTSKNDDLISRTAMLEALGHFNDYVNGDPHFLNGIETAKEITENLPAVDSVPVVRCKDCKYWFGGDDDRVYSCELDALLRPAGWYCAGGERRDEGCG